MSERMIELVERYGAASRAAGIVSVQFMQAKKAAEELLEVIKKQDELEEPKEK